MTEHRRLVEAEGAQHRSQSLSQRALVSVFCLRDRLWRYRRLSISHSVFCPRSTRGCKYQIDMARRDSPFRRPQPSGRFLGPRGNLRRPEISLPSTCTNLRRDTSTTSYGGPVPCAGAILVICHAEHAKGKVFDESRARRFDVNRVGGADFLLHCFERTQ
jgi:hypothetical protein